MENIGVIDLAAMAAVVVAVGAIVTTLVSGWLKNREQDAKNGVAESAATASVFQSLMLENARLTARMDLVVASSTDWQSKFYDLSLKLGISQADVTRLSERIAVLESVKDTLTARLSEFTAAFEKERSGLKAEITTLGERLTQADTRVALLEKEREEWGKERKRLQERIAALEEALAKMTARAKGKEEVTP